MILEFKWTMSRGRDTYGYNICTLYVDGNKVSRCNGGGYDMQGTCLGNWLANDYADRLRRLPKSKFPKDYQTQEPRGFYGLTFHDPNYDPGKARIGKDCTDRTLSKDGECGGMTVEEAEKQGKSVGLERYQAIYAASSPYPTRRHTIPSINGACGFSSVEKIAAALGITLEWLKGNDRRRSSDLYLAIDTKEEQEKRRLARKRTLASR